MAKLQSFNPANNQLVGEMEITTHAQIQELVRTAHIAQKAWGQRPIQQRVDLIQQAYEKLKTHQEELASLITQEMGKTPSEAQREVSYYTGKVSELGKEVMEALQPEVLEDAQTRTTIYYDPLGVCASIAPWNFPLGMPHNLIIPALMAGNAVIFKPSEEVFMVGARYAQILNEFLPPHVLQVVIGTGEQGQQLVQADVQLITFTGSQSTGKKILAVAGNDLKRAILELGGKDPLLVCADANLAQAAEFAAFNSFRNAGQVCVSTEKIFVEEACAQEFLQELRKFTQKITIGPMVNAKQKGIVTQQVQQALAAGAKIYYGDLAQNQGNYFAPLILTEVTPQMSIMQEETFGPVACVMVVKKIEEAIPLANEGQYALGGVVYTQDPTKGRLLARQLTSGMVGINRGPTGAKGAPWVGAKQSGHGHHGHYSGHRQFCQLRILNEPVS